MTVKTVAARGEDMPVVAPGLGADRGPWIFGGILLVGGIALFTALDERRQAQTTEGLEPARETIGAQITSPPPLALPARYEPRSLPVERGQRIYRPRIIERAPVRSYGPPPRGSAPATSPSVQSPVPDEPQAVAERSLPVGPQEIFRALPSRPQITDLPAYSPPTERNTNSDRVMATRLENPAYTVPKGTVIPAVLETALDSTRPGGVRALVSREVRGFDGTRVLIPRGSRLYGEYSTDLSPGQERALVTWTRLVRPDGVIIALDSPASDPLGRAGLDGKVDSNFLGRLGDALLGTTLDIGASVATGAILGDSRRTGGVVVALPGSEVTQTGQTSSHQRTISVRHGTSVSVFVAKDLDFSTVER